MSFFIDVGIQGVTDLDKFLRQEERDRAHRLRDRLKDATALVKESAKRYTQSRRVRAAMGSRVDVKSETEFFAAVGPTRKGAFFAHFLELGTEHSRAFPFLAPAKAETEDKVLELVGRAFEFRARR